MNYDLESIVIKVLANSSGNLLIPLKGYSTSGNTNCPYDWQVSVDNGAETHYSGTGGGSLTIGTGLVPGSEHLVIIKPTTVAYQWARAFGTDEDSTLGNNIIEIVQDLSYIGYGVSATNTGDYFRRSQYAECANLINVADEFMPDTVTTIGNNFRMYQYYNCISVTEAVDEVMSINVTTIGNGFRNEQYCSCSQMVRAAKEFIGNSVTSIGNDFRIGQYYGCGLLSEIYDEVLPETLISVGNNFRKWQYSACTSLVYSVDEYLPESITTIGTYFRFSQYASSGVKYTAKECMPDSLNNIGTYCRVWQYQNCLSLETISGETIIKNATVGNYYRYGQYTGCTGIRNARLYAENRFNNYRTNGCFSATTNPMVITILGDVVDAPTTNSASLTNASVDKIYVDSSLVSGYKNSSKRSNINDDKFVEIPNITGNVDLIFDGDYIELISGIKTTSKQKAVFNGTENWVWDSGNNRVTLNVGTTPIYNKAISTHGGTHNYNSTTKDDGRCVEGALLCCYTTKNSLQDFKDWLAQEYDDGTPVCVIWNTGDPQKAYVTPIAYNTRDGENIISIVQSGPDKNLLKISSNVDVATGGYQTYMFNGGDYTLESDWIEISDTQLLNKQDKITEDNMLSADLVDDSNTINKFVTTEDITNWNGKQDCLTAGPNITLSGATISGDFNFATSSTAAACTTKCVCIPEITQLCTGQQITVMPSVTATNCATNLKLNDFTAYPIRYMNAALTSTTDGYVWGANCLATFVFDGSYWHVVSKSYDTNTTYTLNTLLDAGKKTAGTGTYALSRYSLVMEKGDGTWEKITNTAAAYSTATTKTVNTNGFKLNHIRYYNTTTNVANGALIATNTLANQAASVDLRYSTNCGGTTTWAEGDYIYLVGKMGVDGLFYLDATQRWTNTLPTTNDGKLYIRLGLVLTAESYTMSLLIDRPIFYYDNGIKEYKVADNKQDALISGTNIKTINGCDVLGSGDLCIAGGVSSVNGQTGAVCLTIPTDNCELANGCGYQYVCNMVCDLTGADNTHYPTAKAVADAIQGAGGGDMMKSTYDPCNCNDDAFDYCNFHNTPTIPTDNCQLANGCGYTTCTGTLSSCADVISALGYTPYNSTNPCGYTTCTGTLVAADIACLAQCCDIPTDNCQLANGCGYTTCTGTVSTCLDVISALGYTPYNVSNPCNYINNFAGVISALGYTPYNTTNPCGYTSCTGTLSTCSDITTALGYTPYSNANPCGYTTCTGTLVASDIACINGCCLTQGGDICIQGGTQLCYYSEGSCSAQICIHAHAITSTICNTTTSGIKLNFNDGVCDTYLSVGNNCVEVQTETSGTYIFNDACANGVAKLCDIPSVSGFVQESCVACVNGCCLTQGGNICISGGSGIQNDTTGTTTTVTHIRAGTEAEYALITPVATTIYYVF